jgi:acyl transferase domain-containing protein
VPWPADGRPRRAGVSAFGMSGTNVHVILAEPAAQDAPRAPDPGAEGAGAAPGGLAAPLLAAGPAAWVVAARTAAGLAAQAGQLAAHVAARPGLDPADVAWSLATTRSVFEHRAVITGADPEELASGLAAVAAGRPAPGVVTGSVPAGGAGRVVFVFPGQGAQWAGMGRELAGVSPVFAARLADCGRALAPYVDWSVEDVIAGAQGAPALEAAEVVQPVLWAVMVSLAAVWQAAGIAPDVVVGHSQGEIAAATVAGILTLEDAARVVAVRSRALSGLGAEGGMVSVVMPEAAVRELLARWGDRLSVAAVNSPAATVVSGEPEALAEFQAELAARRVLRWPIPASDFVAHSVRVQELAPSLAAELASIRPQPGQVPLFSTVTCRRVDGTELDAGYWYDNVRQTVRFAEAIRTLATDGHRTFIEVSPHPVLTAGIAETIEDAGLTGIQVITGTLDREDAGPRRLLSALARVHVASAAVDWTAVLGGGRRVELPTYAFQRQRYWPQAPPLPAGVVGGDGAGTEAEARFWAAVEGGDAQALADILPVDGQRPFNEVLPALASWRRQERDRSVTEGWRYRVTWVPAAEPASTALSGTWLVVVPAGTTGGDLADGCVRALTACGARIVVAEAGPDEADRAVLAARIWQVLAAGEDGAHAAGISGVVSLLALDEAPMAGFPMVAAGLAGTQALLQALGDAGIGAPLWVLTRGAVSTGAGEMLTSPVPAQAWGMGRVAGLEHPERWGGLVDLPSVLDERSASRLCGVLAGCGEDQVAIRPAGIMARRLVHAPLPPGRQEPWAPRGSVLITGGTGAIGGHLGRWLAGRAAPRVVLASRSGPAARGAAGQAAQLAAVGTAVSVVACDVGQRAETAGLLAWIGSGGPPLAAVLHTAGLPQASALDDTTLAELAEVMAAKAAGAAHLDELTADLDLDAFVLFSSIAATWGSALQPGYAAANAFLDGLAGHRRGRGLAGTSIAWGPWGGGGMTDTEACRQLERRGLLPMDPQLLTGALGRALDSGEGLVTVADVDWARFAPAYTLRRPSPLIENLSEVRQALADAAGDGEPADADAGVALAQQLTGLSAAEQDRLLTDVVQAEAAAVLGHVSHEAVAAGRAFSELGFDSLTSVELRNRLSAVTGLRLPATLLFDYPAPTELAAHLRAAMIKDEVAPPSSVLAELDKLESLLSAITAEDAESARITGRLEAVMSKWKEAREQMDEVGVAEKLESSTDDEVFDFIGKELGIY